MMGIDGLIVTVVSSSCSTAAVKLHFLLKDLSFKKNSARDDSFISVYRYSPI